MPLCTSILPASYVTCTDSSIARLRKCDGFLPAGARASARTAGPKIALRFSRLFVCLCVRTYHVRDILRHTLLCNCSFGGLQAKLQQMKVV